MTEGALKCGSPIEVVREISFGTREPRRRGYTQHGETHGRCSEAMRSASPKLPCRIQAPPLPTSCSTFLHRSACRRYAPYTQFCGEEAAPRLCLGVKDAEAEQHLRRHSVGLRGEGARKLRHEVTKIALNEGNIISVTGLLVIYLFIVCWNSCIVEGSPNMLL